MNTVTKANQRERQLNTIDNTNRKSINNHSEIQSIDKKTRSKLTRTPLRKPNRKKPTNKRKIEKQQEKQKRERTN